MSSPVQINSEHYKTCNWSATLQSCFVDNDIPTVIANYGNLLIPVPYLSLDQIQIVTPNSRGFVNIKDLEFAENLYLNQCNLRIAKIPATVSQTMMKDSSDDYFKICSSVCQKALDEVRTMLRYTHDHLEERIADGIKLSQHQSIKFSIANIVCDIDFAAQGITTATDIDHLNLALGKLGEALHTLAEVIGGRAMLQGNAIDLMFHLSFIRFALTHKRKGS